MSEHLQLGIEHPDADQLSAFAENALPLHERETLLVHLSACDACRQVLALSQQAIEPAPAPEPRRRSLTQWFSGWNLALAGGLAFAAITLAVVLHHRPDVTPSTQTARNEPPPYALAPPAAEPAPQSPAQPAPVQIGAAPPPLVATNSRIEPARTPSPDSSSLVVEDKPVQDLPVNGRNYQVLPMARAQQQPVIAGSMAQDAVGAALGKAAPTLNAPLAPAPPPPPPVQETVTVAAAAPQIETMDVAAARSVGVGVPSVASAPLPSRLAVASSSTVGQHTLALDTAGGLFSSTDGGQHWKSVHTPWDSRGVCLHLALQQGPACGASTGLRGNEALSASIIGVITDPNGATIPGATVTALGPSNGSTHADGAGHYAISELPTGTYRLRTSAPGFSSVELSLDVDGKKPITANVSLPVGSVSQTVTVASETPIVETRQAAPALAKKKKEEEPVFALETAKGEHWVSSDGRHWRKK